MTVAIHLGCVVQRRSEEVDLFPRECLRLNLFRFAADKDAELPADELSHENKIVRQMGGSSHFGHLSTLRVGSWRSRCYALSKV